jgi:hypothetical protein
MEKKSIKSMNVSKTIFEERRNIRNFKKKLLLFSEFELFIHNQPIQFISNLNGNHLGKQTSPT